NRYNWNGHFVKTRAPIDGVSRNGFGGASNFGYNGKYLGFNTHFDHFSPTFRNTDLGFFFARTNKTETSGGINLYQPDPRGILRRLNVNLFGGRQWNDDGLVFGKWGDVNANFNFQNFWFAFVGFHRNFDRLDDLDTRGGPPIVLLADNGINFGV